MLQDSDEWSVESQGSGTCLCDDGMPLTDGINSLQVFCIMLLLDVDVLLFYYVGFFCLTIMFIMCLFSQCNKVTRKTQLKQKLKNLMKNLFEKLLTKQSCVLLYRVFFRVCHDLIMLSHNDYSSSDNGFSPYVSGLGPHECVSRSQSNAKVKRKREIKVPKVRTYWCVVRIRKYKERLVTEALFKYVVVKKAKLSSVGSGEGIGEKYCIAVGVSPSGNKCS